MRIHHWRLSLNRLPTKDNLGKKGVLLIDDLCPLCKDFPESRDHIFVTCRLAAEVRAEINNWWNIMVNNGSSLEDMVSRLFAHDDNNRKKVI